MSENDSTDDVVASDSDIYSRVTESGIDVTITERQDVSDEIEGSYDARPEIPPVSDPQWLDRDFTDPETWGAERFVVGIMLDSGDARSGDRYWEVITPFDAPAAHTSMRLQMAPFTRDYDTTTFTSGHSLSTANVTTMFTRTAHQLARNSEDIRASRERTSGDVVLNTPVLPQEAEDNDVRNMLTMDIAPSVRGNWVRTWYESEARRGIESFMPAHELQFTTDYYGMPAVRVPESGVVRDTGYTYRDTVEDERVIPFSQLSSINEEQVPFDTDNPEMEPIYVPNGNVFTR